MNAPIKLEWFEKPLTKVERKIRCREILQTTRGRVEPVNHRFLMLHVFPTHPDWEDKRGVGVSHIEVRRHGEFKSLGFWLRRTDGTEIDISYITSLDGVRPHDKFLRAARAEVQSQITDWRKHNPAQIADMHVDHAMPFEALLRAWLADEGLAEADVEIWTAPVGFTELFANRNLAVRWQHYHARYAKLQWLTAIENLKKSNKWRV